MRITTEVSVTYVSSSTSWVGIAFMWVLALMSIGLLFI